MADDANYTNPDLEQLELLEFCHLFCFTAGLQGRLAYFLMSFHAVNPYIFSSICSYDPSTVLYANMVYGVGVMILWRPAMHPLGFLHRASFGILGSLMFNHSSMSVYNWLVEHFSHRPCLLTFLGFISGRVMMMYLLAFLYHFDRTRGRRNRIDSQFEDIYR